MKTRKRRQSGGRNSKSKYSKRPSLKELNQTRRTKLGDKRYHNMVSRTKVKEQNTRDSVSNKQIVDIVERLFIKFKHFRDKVYNEDDPTEIKDRFQTLMCKDGFLVLVKPFVGSEVIK